MFFRAQKQQEICDLRNSKRQNRVAPTSVPSPIVLLMMLAQTARWLTPTEGELVRTPWDRPKWRANHCAVATHEGAAHGGSGAGDESGAVWVSLDLKEGAPEGPLRDSGAPETTPSWPKRGDECQKGPLARPKLVQDLSNEHERWECIRLKTVPHLEKGVRARCHGVVQWRKVCREPVVEGCGKKIDRNWPHHLQDSHDLLSQGPLGI